MLGIVRGVHPLAIELGCNISGQAHGAAFFANCVSAGFRIDGNQQRRVFNVRRLSLRRQDVWKRESNEDECENVKLWGLRHGGIRRLPNFLDFSDDGHPLALYCELLLILSFNYIVNPEISKPGGTRMKNKLLILLLVLCGVALWPAIRAARGQQTQPKEQIGYGAAPDAEQKKTLLLRDFHPVQMLHAPVHNADKAKYYVIDVHNHVNDAQGIDEHMPPEQVVKIMDDTNVKTVVILTGMSGDKMQRVIDETVKTYPGRYIVLEENDFSKIDDPSLR